jgi:hypothetical protein
MVRHLFGKHVTSNHKRNARSVRFPDLNLLGLMLALAFVQKVTRGKGCYRVLSCGFGVMADAFTAARKRQLARLGGAKPPWRYGQ